MSDEESGDFFLNNSDDNWEPLPDDFKFVSRNSSSSSSSSSSHSDINNLAVALSEFQIKPPTLPPPPPPSQIQKKIIIERPIKNTIHDYFLSFISPHQVWEADKIVDFYNYIVKPKKMMTTKGFGYLKFVKQNFKRFQKRNNEGKRKVYYIKK